MPISIIVAQGSPLAGQLLCRALKEKRGHFALVGCVDTTKDLLKQAAERHPDVAQISSSLGNDPEGGLRALRELRAAGSTARPIVLLDCSEAERVIDAFSAGAKGVVCQDKPFEVVCKCIQSVHAGQIWADSRQLQLVLQSLGEREPVRVASAKGTPLLTKREEQIMNLLVDGLPNREIGVKLGVSAHTVKNHLFHIYEKLGVSNRVELILYAITSREASRGSSTKTSGDA